MLAPNALATPVYPMRLEAPRVKGQNGVKQRASKMESGRLEFESCLCYFQSVGPGASCLTFLSLFPCPSMRLLRNTLRQVAEGGPSGSSQRRGLVARAMMCQDHRKPPRGQICYGFCSGFWGSRCLHSPCTQLVLCTQPPLGAYLAALWSYPEGLWPGMRVTNLNLDKMSLETCSTPGRPQQSYRATFPANRCPWLLSHSIVLT